MSDNLPSWPGAAICYSRAYVWMSALNRQAYRLAKKKKAWREPDDVTACRKALDAGDEETIKALNHRYQDHWLKGATP